MRRNGRLALVMISMAASWCLAQTSGDPHPTQLRLGVRDSEILLAWIDATSGTNVYGVYRHTSPVTAGNAGSATFLGDVPQGRQTFSDYPPTTDKYYYAVLAKDSKGNPYKVFMPTVNATSTGLAVKVVKAVPATTPVAESRPATGPATTPEPVLEIPSVEEPPKAAATEPPKAASTERTAETTTFHPENLRLGVRESQIILSWETPTPPAGGWFLVYRHGSEIRADNLAKAKLLAQIPATVLEYIDTPPDRAAYFYAVVYKASGGATSASLVQLENTSVIGVTVRAEEALTTGSVATIKAIDAKVDASTVRISYKTSKIGRRLVIYRSTVPVVDVKTLLESSLVSVFTDSGETFIDYPVPGIPYYYAIIDEEQLKYGAMTLVSGDNATARPVQIEAGVFRVALPSYSASLSRSMPLPFLSLSSGVTPGRPTLAAGLSVPERLPLSSETQKSVNAVLGTLDASDPKAPTIAVLPPDLLDAVGSEDYTLKVILKEQFLAGNYQGAIVQLQKFLSLYRTEEIEARAHFYLGEAYALSGNYREAFFEFLQAQGSYYAQTLPWIDYLLRMLHRP